MDDHDQPGVLPQPLLHDRLDRRPLQPEHLGDLGEHAGAVGDLHVQVERRHHVLDDLELLDGLGRRARRQHRAHHVAEHGAGRLRPPGARAGHRDLGDRLGLDRHRVEGPVDRGQRVPGVQERRMYAHRQASVDALGGADELEPEPEVARVLDVVGRKMLDPLVAHLLEMDRRVEREPREDGHLRGGVLAVDVLRRVGLGIPEALRLREHVGVAGAGARHLGEDEVRRPVDDAVDAVDLGARQRLLHHADHRHHPRDRRLETQLHAVAARRRPQLLTVLGQQLLVGGDDVAARLQRAQDVVARGIQAPDHFDHEIRGLEHILERASAARQHAADLRPAARELLDVRGARLEQIDERGAHGAVAEDPDAEDVRHRGSRGRRRCRGAPPRARRRP